MPQFARALCLFLLATCLAGTIRTARAGDNLEQWRQEATRVRQLAENDAPAALQQARQLQADLPNGALPADQIRALNILARSETYLGLMTEADAHARQAHEQAERHDDIVGQVEADLCIALNAVNQNRLDAVTVAATHAMTLAGQIPGHPELLVEAMVRAASIYRRSGQFEDSVLLSMQAMEIANSSKSPLAMTYAHHGMANAYDLSSHNMEAKEHFTRMLEMSRASGSRLLEAQALTGLGLITSRLGNPQRGEAMVKESIATFRSVGAPFALSMGLYTLADIYRQDKRYAAAVPLIAESLALYERYDNKIGLWWQLLGRSRNYEAMGNFARARADIERDYALAKEIGQAYFIVESARRMALFLASDGDYRSAYHYAREANEISSRQTQEKTSSRMLELAQRHQDENKQRQLDELTRREQERKQEERWLWTLLMASVTLLAISTAFAWHLRRAQLRKAELNRQLLHSRNKLQATLDAIPDLLFELDIDGRCYDYHSPRTDLLAAPPEALLGKTPGEVLPPEAAKICLSALHEANDKGISSGHQFFIELPQGITWFELSVAKKPAADGQEVRFIVLSRNITNRKQREGELALLNYALDQVGEAVFLYGDSRRFSYVNAYAAQHLGYTREELLGMGMADIDPDYQEERMEAHWRDIQRCGSMSFESRHKAKDGRILPVEVMSNYFESGNQSYSLALCRDITERKQKEREITESRDLLRELTAHRDHAREEERKHIAREIHDQLGQMLTAQRLDIATLKFQFGEALPPLAERLEHLLGITDQTIQVVRSIATALRPVALDMGTLPALEWLIGEFRTRTSVICCLRFNIPDASLNELQSIAVFRIVQESLTNVARYADARQVEITLERSSNNYLLSIRDDGKGFDLVHVRPRSFGLLGIRERVQMLGGNAHIISSPERGTAIEVTFPITQRKDPTDDQTPAR